jgi:hypothetical protein
MACDDSSDGHEKRARSPRYRELLRARRPSEVFLREAHRTQHQPEPDGAAGSPGRQGRASTRRDV